MQTTPKIRLNPPKMDEAGQWLRWENMTPALWRDAPEHVLCWRYGWDKPYKVAVGADDAMNVNGLYWFCPDMGWVKKQHDERNRQMASLQLHLMQQQNQCMCPRCGYPYSNAVQNYHGGGIFGGIAGGFWP